MSIPIPMLLTCPVCGARHIDRGEFATKEHHTHACQACGHVWRPAIVATVGVQYLPGFKHEDPECKPPHWCICGRGDPHARISAHHLREDCQRCTRCGAPYDCTGSCSNRPCQGGLGEWCPEHDRVRRAHERHPLGPGIDIPGPFECKAFITAVNLGGFDPWHRGARQDSTVTFTSEHGEHTVKTSEAFARWCMEDVMTKKIVRVRVEWLP